MKFTETLTPLERKSLDTIDGLKSDLDSALEVMTAVVQRKQSVASMGRFISLNYPKLRPALPKSMRVLPHKRSS
jgi:hypothetical protein